MASALDSGSSGPGSSPVCQKGRSQEFAWVNEHSIFIVEYFCIDFCHLQQLF